MAPGTPLRILIAPLAFKGTLSARRAAGAMARGACQAAAAQTASSQSACTLSLDLAPFADGGDGSVDALVAAGWTRLPITARDAMGVLGSASIACRDDTVAVEIANTCGLARHMSRALDPMTASSSGLGDAILAALDHRPTEVIVFLGGSASTDGGAGMLTTLGAVHDDWQSLDLSGLDPRLSGVHFTVATDVTSPLHGPLGAAAVFAPQKAADPSQVLRLDERLVIWGRTLLDATGTDVADLAGAGAAGGTAAALMAAFGARRESGADYLARELRIDDRIAAADLVITGEGSLDEQSLLGKGSLDLVERATRAGIPVAVVCGRVALDPGETSALGINHVRALIDIAGAGAMTGASSAVQVAACQVVAEALEIAGER